MSDLRDVAIAIVSGVAIFVVGQIVSNFLLEPLQRYRELVGKISYSLIFYGNATTTLQDIYFQDIEALKELPEPKKSTIENRYLQVIQKDWDNVDDAKRTLRQQASELMSASNAIPLYNLWAILGIIPRRKYILKASENLIGLSNSSSLDGPSDRRKEIAKALNIEILIQRYGK